MPPRKLSKIQRMFRQMGFSMVIYMGVQLLVLQHFPGWVTWLFVFNMAWGYQQIDDVFKKMGTSTLHEAYTFTGCLRFLTMVMAWPLVMPSLKEKAASYQASVDEARKASREIDEVK